MKKTITEIAKMAGVSRAVVDRVIHQRGKVDPEKEQRVLELLRQYNYKPNKMARALSLSKHKRKVAVILNSIGNAYFDCVIKGIQDATLQFKNYGLSVEIIELKGFKVDEQIAVLERVLNDGVEGIVFTPINHPDVRRKITEIVNQDIRVIAVNTDINLSDRHHYIGCDYHLSGQMAAGFLNLINPSKPIRIGVLQGSNHIEGHFERLKAFIETLEAHIDVLFTESCEDDETHAYHVISHNLALHDLDYLYVNAGGLAGAMKAITECKKEIHVIGHDLTEVAIAGLNEGKIKMTIDQQPYAQGYQSIKVLYDYFYHKEITIDSIHHLKLSYITKYNLK